MIEAMLWIPRRIAARKFDLCIQDMNAAVQTKNKNRKASDPGEHDIEPVLVVIEGILKRVVPLAENHIAPSRRSDAFQLAFRIFEETKILSDGDDMPFLNIGRPSKQAILAKDRSFDIAALAHAHEFSAGFEWIFDC